MTLLLAVAAGVGLGVVLQQGEFCFHSTWRRFFGDPQEVSLMRAYVALVLLTTPVVQVMIAIGIIDPFIPPFAPAAALIGGLLFGVGMVVAKTCVSGMFYKLGAGMVAMVVAIGAWAVGDLLTWRGPLRGIRERLTDNPITATDADGVAQTATVSSWMGPLGVFVFILVGIALAAWTVRSEAVAPGRSWLTRDRASLNGVRLGAVAGAVIVVAWLLSRWHGSDYAFGTSGSASSVWGSVVRDEAINWWIPVSLVSVVLGAGIAATVSGKLWIRGEESGRYVELGAGGLLMGVGAGIAGGCNLGHSMVGVPLLSIGSIVTTVAIGAGVFAADSVVRSISSR